MMPFLYRGWNEKCMGWYLFDWWESTYNHTQWRWCSQTARPCSYHSIEVWGLVTKFFTRATGRNSGLECMYTLATAEVHVEQLYTLVDAVHYHRSSCIRISMTLTVGEPRHDGWQPEAKDELDTTTNERKCPDCSELLRDKKSRLSRIAGRCE
jgi:hypothetical protein